MRSTDPAGSFALSYRRAEVTGFWVVITAVSAAAAAAVGAALGHSPLGWSLTVAAIVIIPGAFRRTWFEDAIWIWNGVSRRLAAALRRYVLAVCYFVVISAVGTAGSRLEVAPGTPRRSLWTATRADAGSTAAAHAGLMRFSRHAGCRWTLVLAPFLFLLARLREDHEQVLPPGSTYTLY